MSSNFKNIDEKKLAAHCVKHDGNAQKLLYQRFYGEMMAVCMRYANNRAEAAEILNDGFLKVFENIGKYQPEYSLQGWVRKIIVNTAIDTFRRNRQYYFMMEAESANEEQTLQPAIIDHFAAEDIIKLIQELPPVYKVVFNLYVIEGYSHQEIAEQLQITESTSRANLVKARRKLQQMIQQLEPSIYERYAK